jgi:hypothetical protein
VSSKVVPTLSGIDMRRARSLWPTFLLLNLGNLTRVSFQIATDFSPAAYKVMGVSGFIEVVGLTLWGYELFSNMRAGKKIQNEFSRLKEVKLELEITPTVKVGDVLDRYPQSLDVFVRHGFTPLRKTMARVITIEQACRREGVEMSELLRELNTIAETSVGSGPLVSITKLKEPQAV